TSWPLNLVYTRENEGISCWHGWHQVAQKFTTRTLPCSASGGYASPLVSMKTNGLSVPGMVLGAQSSVFLVQAAAAGLAPIETPDRDTVEFCTIRKMIRPTPTATKVPRRERAFIE